MFMLIIVLFHYMIVFIIIKKLNYLVGQTKIIVIYVNKHVILIIHQKYLLVQMFYY